MPTLKRDRSAMSDEGSRKRAKTSPFDDTPAVQPPMDMDAVTEEPLVKPAVDAPPSQELTFQQDSYWAFAKQDLFLEVCTLSACTTRKKRLASVSPSTSSVTISPAHVLVYWPMECE